MTPQDMIWEFAQRRFGPSWRWQDAAAALGYSPNYIMQVAHGNQIPNHVLVARLEKEMEE